MSRLARAPSGHVIPDQRVLRLPAQAALMQGGRSVGLLQSTVALMYNCQSVRGGVTFEAKLLKASGLRMAEKVAARVLQDWLTFPEHTALQILELSHEREQAALRFAERRCCRRAS